MSSGPIRDLAGNDRYFEHFRAPNANTRQPYPDALQRILNLRETSDARASISSLPGYAATALHSLPALASATGVAQLLIKDESTRFGLRAFKAMGGIYALFCLLRARAARLGQRDIDMHDLLGAEPNELAAALTVACATTGNHGRSVARAAQIFGCRCVIYVPRGTTAGRVAALEAFGAQVVHHDGTYDSAVARAQHEAAVHGWCILSDTAYPGQADTPRDVMHGYRVIADEIVQQVGSQPPPTHVFVQAGVGGLAAAVCSHFWEVWQSARPRYIVVEPRYAACMLQSARGGERTDIAGPFDTRMYGLASGQPSSLAWEILARGADDFVSIEDAASFHAMHVLASPLAADPPIIAGEAGAAGLGALLVASSSADYRGALNLDRASRVLLIVTEGATDPATYAAIVGRTMEQVLMGQRTG